MSASEQLYRLADRAKRAETAIDEAKTKTRDELRSDVAQAREDSQRRANELKAGAESAESKASSWWGEVQQNWQSHVAKVRENIADKQAEHDVKRAEREAEQAEDDAEAAVDFAYAALEEAEYAVLDAALARLDADALAAAN